MSGGKDSVSSRPPVFYELLHQDSQCWARRGRLTTPHGVVETPVFMPVGTQGTVKGLTVDALRTAGTQMLLGNTYHLALRPGDEVVEQLGGLHRFMGWTGPILTDSGGFQVFSLSRMVRVDESGVTFRSHIDGSRVFLGPERSIEIQERLGSDVAMVFDHVVGLPAPMALVEEACDRSIRWAERCKNAARRPDQAVYAIVQGGLSESLRKECARRLVALDFPGYAVGGLSVGETAAEMHRILDATVPELPKTKPRYLMGVGRPEDLLNAIARGIDLFDCVMPTRNGRNAMAFTDQGPIKLRNRQYQTDSSPIQQGMPGWSGEVSRGYLRHLFMAGEMLGPILVSWHNVAYYQRLMRQAREAIEADCFRDFYFERMAGWGLASSWPVQ